MKKRFNSVEMTSRDYIGVLFRHKTVVLTTIITVMVLVIVGLMFRTHVFQAEVKMLVSGQKQAQASYYTDIEGSSMRSAQITLTQSEIVTSDPVIERTVAALGLGHKPFDYENTFASWIKKPFITLQKNMIERKMAKFTKEQKDAFLFRLAVEDLRQRLKVEPVRETDMFVIKVTDYNPVGAAVTANVVSRSYAIFDLEQQLAEMQLKYGAKNMTVLQLQESIDKLSSELKGSRLPPIEAIGPATVKIIEQAKVPMKPAGIPRGLIIVLAFFMSMFLAVMMAFVFDYTDQTFKSAREGERFLGLDHLASLPKKASKAQFDDVSEELYLALKEKGVKSVLFSSATHAEGVTALVTHFGAYAAEHLNKKVLLIDGNLRNPALHRIFNLSEEDGGIVPIVEGRLAMDTAVKNIGNNLDVLGAGIHAEASTLNPIALLESDIVSELIKKAAKTYDLVFIDSAPFSESRDAAILSATCDGVVIVINERKVRRQVVRNALGPLKARNANMLGFILNDRTFVMPRMIYNRL